MKTAHENRAWLKDLMGETGLSAAELSRLSGVHKATIHRALKEDYEFVPSARTMDKLLIAIMDYAREKGVANVLEKSARLESYPDRVPLMYELQAGLRPVTSVVPEPSELIYNQKIAPSLQIAARVLDRSADEFFEPGDTVHVLHHHVFDTIEPKPGDHLIVVRENIDNDEREVRILELVRIQGDDALLRAPTLDPAFAFQGEFSLRRSTLFHLEESSVLGLVIAVHRPLHFLAR